jgi:hypothetical protein
MRKHIQCLSSDFNLLPLNRGRTFLSQITSWASHSGLASCSQRLWVHPARGQGHVPTDGVAALRTLPCLAVPGWCWSGWSGWHGWTTQGRLPVGRKFHIWGSWQIADSLSCVHMSWKVLGESCYNLSADWCVRVTIMSVKQPIEWELAKETQVFGKNCPSATLPTTNPTSPVLGLNLGCCDGKPAT